MKTKLLILVVALICVAQLYAYDCKIDGIAYNLNQTDKTAEVVTNVTGTVDAVRGHVSIPSSITYNSQTYSVTMIGDYAYVNCRSLTSITIPNSVTTIGDFAFDNCGLTSVTIPNSVTTIGNNAFGCINLTSVTIGQSVKTIGNNAFSHGSKLTKTNYTGTIADWCKIDFDDYDSNPIYYSHNFYINNVEVKDLVIPEGVDTIGDYAFYSCSGLTSVTITNSVTTIGSSAFSGCYGLISVTIPNSVTTIGDYAFSSCSGLTSPVYNANCFVYMPTSYQGAYTIPNGITQIAGYAFYNCSGLTSVTIPNSVTTIGDFAFDRCSGLTSVTIPNSVTEIGDYAFSGCSGLASVTIPNSVTTIGNSAFQYCRGLTSPVYNANCFAYMPSFYRGTYTISDGITQIAGGAFRDCYGLTSITIPNSVTTIGDEAFLFCSGLKTPVYNANCFAYMPESYQGAYTIPSGIKQIAGYAFWGCSGLTSITIPNSVTTIGSSAFDGCSGLTSVTIPNSVTTIGYRAFFGCSGLITVTIGNSVTTIGDWAFYDCDGLTKTNYTGTIADWCKIDFDDYNSNPIYYSHNFYINDVEVKDLVIPEGVDTIGDFAFYHCSGLTSIIIPKSITTIENDAFRQCENLKTIYNGSSLLLTKGACNYGWVAQNADLIYPGVPVGDFIIKNDTILYKYIGTNTIVIIPNSITTIGENAFRDCSGLTSVTIPNSVTTIGDYAFSGCSGLTIVTIPNSVTTIGKYAFEGCSGLTSITIPNSVTTIGSSAFSGCRGLTTITCETITPPTCGTWCFNNVPTSIPVHVPARSVDIYKKADEWRKFTNIQGFPEEYAMITCLASNGTITGGGKLIKGDTCTLEVTINYGYHFTQWSDGNTDNPRSFVITQDSTFTAQIDIAQSGQCGDDLYWRLVGDTLIITGSGEMYDYTESHLAEWYLSNDKITKLIMDDGITHIGDYAFYGLSNKNLKEISLPNSVETIGKYAFAECSYLKTITLGAKLEDIDEYAFQNDERLLYVNCYAEEPPVLQETAFDNYDIYLQVPCDVLDEYKVAKGWKLFNRENVSCLSAEGKTVTGDDVIVTPSATTATFVWPSNDKADSYSLEITKDGAVFCTLTFNAQGQLTGIAFAPSRGHTAMAHAATSTNAGWQFTVTGLNQASKYAYTMDVKNASQKSIKTYTGEFATDGYTDLLPLPYDGKDGIGSVKFIKNGRLLIERNSIRYNAHGARVK